MFSLYVSVTVCAHLCTFLHVCMSAGLVYVSALLFLQTCLSVCVYLCVLVYDCVCVCAYNFAEQANCEGSMTDWQSRLFN